tara:strand:- start:69 stop:251 length:183 start_codon:yes stop_codon:yes gene_type:complete
MTKGKKIPFLKHHNHDKIINDYGSAKKKHLEKLATKMLKKDEEFSKLKNKKINNNFLNLF